MPAIASAGAAAPVRRSSALRPSRTGTGTGVVSGLAVVRHRRGQRDHECAFRGPPPCVVRRPPGNIATCVAGKKAPELVPVRGAATISDVVVEVPGGLPVFGNTLQLDLRNIYASIDALFNEHNTQVLKVKLFSSVFIHTRNAEDVRQAFRDQEDFPKSQIVSMMTDWMGEGLALETNIPKHAAMRRLLNPAFRTDYIRGLSPVFSQVGERLADAVLEMGEHDIQDLAMRATIDIIGLSGFRYDFGSLDLATGKRASPVMLTVDGRPMDVAQLFEELVAGLSNQFAFAGFSPRREWIPGYKEYMNAIASLDRVIDVMLAERRSQGVEKEDLDLISFCLRAMEQDPDIMTDKQIRDELHTMLFAGSDTTANTLSWMFYEMARRPDIMQRALAEVDELFASGADISPMTLDAKLPFITGCFKEALRVYPPVTALNRVAAQDITLQGTNTHMKAGETIMVAIWSLHRNPMYWVRPEEFCPERWLPEGVVEFGPVPEDAWVPFGGGPRICIGKYFALCTSVQMKTHSPLLQRDPLCDLVRQARQQALLCYMQSPGSEGAKEGAVYTVAMQIMEGQVIAAQVLRKVRFEKVPGFTPEVASRITLTSTNGIRIKAVPRS